MYGSYTPPLSFKGKNFYISLKKQDNIWKYYRKIEKDETEKTVVFSKSEIIINPVEPVNLPKEICSYLFIEFSKDIILAPKERIKFYITFPIEIAVILSSGKNFKLLDIFTFVQPKYTVYGDVTTGVICKYWKSDIYTKIPKTNILKEGVIEVNAFNNSSEWVDIKQLVFTAYGMKIYYNKSLVSMRAIVKILGEEIAETSFIDSPLKADMKKSIEIFRTKKIVIPLHEKFIMEEGLC
ncbi:MAG TPA: DUF432 domain-containing protein [Nanoarchaeota archaeon]|nr:DUF432 domain-containing protein [Nanoarchaeota archaeon]